MPYATNYGGLINQLYRQRDNIENMINQYTGSTNSQPAPVQNIINTSNAAAGADIKYLGKDDDINNIIVTKKTIFIDKPKAKISIKETDGTISDSFDIIIPKDEKDIKIEELENKIKELEAKVNDQSTKSNVAVDDVKSTSTGTIKSTKSATITSF